MKFKKIGKVKILKIDAAILAIFLILPMILLLLSYIKTPSSMPIDLEFCSPIVSIKEGVDITTLPFHYLVDEIKSRIMLVTNDWKQAQSAQSATLWELRPFRTVSHHAVTEFAIGFGIPLQAMKVLDGQKLRDLVNKELDKFTPIFVTHFTIVSATVKDIDQNGILDIILRVTYERDEYCEEDVCAYEVFNGQVRCLWSYHLDKNTLSLFPLWSLDRIRFRADGTVEVIILKPFEEVSVIQFDPSRRGYVKSKVALLRLPSLWPMAVESIFSLPKWFLGYW